MNNREPLPCATLPVLATAAALLCSLVASCGREAVPSSPSPAVLVPGPASSPLPQPSPSPTSAVMPALPAPEEVLRTGSGAIITTLADGSAFDPAHSSPQAEAIGRTLSLRPATQPMGQRETAYALYRFQLPGYSGPAQIEFGGGVNYEYEGAPLTWVALANWSTGRWDWQPVPKDGVLKLSALAPYLRQDGSLALVWLQLYTTSNQARQLNWLRVGASQWSTEQLPFDFDSCLLRLRADGTPFVVTRDYQDTGLALWQRAFNGAWSGTQLSSDTTLYPVDMLFDASGEPQILANRHYQPGQDSSMREAETFVFSPSAPQVATSIAERSFTVGNGGPGAGGLPRPLQGRLVQTPAGLAASCNLADVWAIALEQDGSWTTAAPPPGDTDDLATLTTGALLALTRGYDPWAPFGGVLGLYELNGSGWQSAAPQIEADNVYSGTIVSVSPKLQVLATYGEANPNLFTLTAAGWTAEELRDATGGQVPFRYVTVDPGADVLRFTDNVWVYTRTGWGTLDTRPIDIPDMWPQAVAFDSEGKMHIVGQRPSTWPPEYVYAVEP
jgi:hypothetical protein